MYRSNDSEYLYHYPLRVFSGKQVFQITAQYFSLIKKRNPYYRNYLRDELATVQKRIISLHKALPCLIEIIKKKSSNRKILSIYCYGSFLYSNPNYIPDDIDIGVIVEGSYFSYFLDGISIPQTALKKTNIGVKKMQLFCYGFDNLCYGEPVEDTVKSSTIHTETVKRELSVAYWRNIVIYGMDFCKINNDKQNLYKTMNDNLKRVSFRIKNYGHTNESKQRCLEKIANRLYEATVFAKLIFPNQQVDTRELSGIPVLAQRGEWSKEEALNWYNKTILLYNSLSNTQ